MNCTCAACEMLSSDLLLLKNLLSKQSDSDVALKMLTSVVSWGHFSFHILVHQGSWTFYMGKQSETREQTQKQIQEYHSM